MSRVESKPVISGEELVQAMDFAMDYFNRVYQDREISQKEHDELMLYYRDQRDRARDHRPLNEMTLRPKDVCWSCRGRLDPSQSICPNCGAPVQGDRVERLRHLVFLCFEIKKHERAGRLTLSASHGMLAESNERIAAMRRKLDKERAPMALPTTQPVPVLELAPEAPPEEKPVEAPPPRKEGGRSARRSTPEAEAPARRAPAAPKRSMIEILLDPRSIQWLLAFGGALLALGLMIWLIASGIFANKVFGAVLLGGGSVLLLAGGLALVLASRYKLAGRALTLLACLVLPLNLWFYSAQDLISLDSGLWIPALVICALYALSARVLRDVMFVPVFVLGVTATGLLMLADHNVRKLYEVAAPATLLVIIGVICLHVERVFPDTESPFGRKKFGLAFFWSGQVVLGAGLLLILGAQLGGWFILSQTQGAPIHEIFLFNHHFSPSDIVTKDWGKLLALGLVLAGTYCYLYSDLVVRRVGVYIPIAVCTLLWSEVLLISMVTWSFPQVEVVILALAITAMLVNVVVSASLSTEQAKTEAANAPARAHGHGGGHGHSASAKKESMLFRVGPALGLVLGILPVFIGLVHHMLIVTQPFNPEFRLQYSSVVVMVVTAVVCRMGAHSYRHTRPGLSVMYFFGTAGATMVAAAALLVVSWENSTWAMQAPMIMLIPIAYLIAARLYRGHSAERPLVWVAHSATGLMLFISLTVVYVHVVNREFEAVVHQNRLLALFFAEAALFYILAAFLHRHPGSVYLATAAGCAAMCLLFNSWNFAAEFYLLAFAIVGMVLLIGYRLAVLDRYGELLASAAFACGNGLASLAFVGAALMTLGKLANFNQGGMSDTNTLRNLLFALVGINLVVLALIRKQAWRRWYVVTTIVNAALAVVVVAFLLNLTPGQKMEIVCLVIGVGMLLAAHIGWYREQDREDDMVSLGLVFGSLLVAIPLTFVVLGHRIGANVDPSGGFAWFYNFNEVGMLAAGLLLLTTGFLFQLRATTVVGGILMALYLLTLLFFIPLPETKSIALYIMIGGGIFFLVGLLLSIYRDRLLTLPDRIKRREGIFKVLTWR
jgi:hypothetical protein